MLGPVPGFVCASLFFVKAHPGAIIIARPASLLPYMPARYCRASLLRYLPVSQDGGRSGHYQLLYGWARIPQLPFVSTAQTPKETQGLPQRRAQRSYSLEVNVS